jgi:hypothetical protein
MDMFKIKLDDERLAIRHDIKSFDDVRQWVSVDDDGYVSESEATIFHDAEEANEMVLPWEVIVKID